MTPTVGGPQTQSKSGTLRTMSLSITRGVRRIHGSYVAELRGANGNLERLNKKNLKFWEIRMIEGPHTHVMPTILQDHNKMDSKLVGKNILVMV